MSSCNYRLLNDLYNSVDTNLEGIAQKLDELDVSLKIDEIDLDLDNLERQLLIAYQLKLLELVGIDIMTEEEQTAAYESIKNEIFAPSASGGTMEEEDGEF